MPEIPQLTQSDLLNQLLSLFPIGWASDDARAPGGTLWALYESLAGSLEDQLGATPRVPNTPTIQFARDLTRIATATGLGLDTISQDLFGSMLPRLINESDASYRARIRMHLFRPKVTRAAIIAALQAMTGQTPRVTEPFNPGDTGAYDERTYYDCDFLPTPARYGDILAYQGMVELFAPTFSVTGGQPVYGYDMGAAYDDPRTAYFDFFAITDPGFVDTIDQLLLDIKAEGTLIWRRLTTAIPLGLPLGAISGVLSIPAGDVDTTQTSMGPMGFLANYFGEFSIFVETPKWNTTMWIGTPGVEFVCDFSNPAFEDSQLAWVALDYGRSYRIPINGDNDSPQLKPTGGITSTPFVMALYNTRVWITGIDANQVTFGLSKAGPGSIFVAMLPGAINGVAALLEGDVSVNVVIPGVKLPYAVIVIPTWNTDVWVTNKADGSFVANFSSPAPAGGGTLYYAVVEALV